MKTFMKPSGALNAFISICSDEQIDIYKKNHDETLPLSGMTFSVKDNILTKDFPTTIGTALLKDFNPGRNAEIVDQLENAGAFLVGKNNMPEFCQSMTSNNANYGPVLNPHNSNWIAGGSSSGSAAAVAGELVDFAIGSDTGGSVNIPAALCGCYGYRPTTGRYTMDGFVPVSPSIDAAGLLTRNIDLISRLDAILSQEDDVPNLRIETLRIGVPKSHFYDGLDADLEDVVTSTLGEIESAGASLIYLDLIQALAENASAGFPIAFYEMLREASMFFMRENLDLSVKAIIDGVNSPIEKASLLAQATEQAIPRADYVRAIQTQWPLVKELISEQFDLNNLDMIVVPTTAIPAIDQRTLGEDGMIEGSNPPFPVFVKYIQNTEIFSNFGGPCLSMPIGKTREGRPVGLLFIGRPNEDRKFLAKCAKLDDTRREHRNFSGYV